MASEKIRTVMSRHVSNEIIPLVMGYIGDLPVSNTTIQCNDPKTLNLLIPLYNKEECKYLETFVVDTYGNILKCGRTDLSGMGKPALYYVGHGGLMCGKTLIYGDTLIYRDTSTYSDTLTCHEHIVVIYSTLGGSHIYLYVGGEAIEIPAQTDILDHYLSLVGASLYVHSLTETKVYRYELSTCGRKLTPITRIPKVEGIIKLDDKTYKWSVHVTVRSPKLVVRINGVKYIINSITKIFGYYLYYATDNHHTSIYIPDFIQWMVDELLR